jgi:hypothetical protein
VGDPITISDEPGATDKGVETPQVEGRIPWPIGLHSVEEKKRNDEEERRKE